MITDLTLKISGGNRSRLASSLARAFILATWSLGQCTTYQTTYTNTAALFTRSGPSRTEPSRNLLPNGTKLRVTKDGTPDTIEKLSGKWRRIEGEPATYVFDGYLSPAAPAKDGSLVIRLDQTDPFCYGTDFFQSYRSTLTLSRGRFLDKTHRGWHGGELDIQYEGEYVAYTDGLLLTYLRGKGFETIHLSNKKRTVSEIPASPTRLYWHDGAKGFLTEAQLRLTERPDITIDRKRCRLLSKNAWPGKKGCIENVEDYGRVIVSDYFCVPET